MRFLKSKLNAILLHDESGSALIELGLVLSFLGVPMLLGTVYVGTLLADYIEISNASHAGAVYAMRSSTYAEENTGIIAAAQAEASDFGTNLTVTPSMYYACSNAVAGTQYATLVLANAACTGGSSHTLQFVKVTVSVPVTPSSKFPGLPRSMTLSSTSVMEVEE